MHRAGPAAPSGCSDTRYFLTPLSKQLGWVFAINDPPKPLQAKLFSHKSELRNLQALFNSADKWREAIALLTNNSHFTQPAWLGLAGPSQTLYSAMQALLQETPEGNSCTRISSAKQCRLKRYTQPRIRMLSSPLWLVWSESRRSPVQGRQRRRARERQGRKLGKKITFRCRRQIPVADHGACAHFAEI